MDEFGSTKRRALHDILVILLGSSYVYFQPPASIKMTYPCITYFLDTINTSYADSIKYKNKTRYTVTIIDKNPESEIPNSLMNLEYCSFDRHFVADNLHHFTFILYY
jgi:hypothetical protein